MAHILCGAWPDDAGRYQGRLLQGEIVILGERRGGDDVPKLRGEMSTLRRVNVVFPE